MSNTKNVYEYDQSSANLGCYLDETEAALNRLDRDNVVRRLWQMDHTVWARGPEEIVNRLGWLAVTDFTAEHMPLLETFAQEVKDEGFKHVVLLGMGGSSLGPEILRQIMGSTMGFPELIVLDSTVPEWIESVTATLDLSHTLFLVSSKSGRTIESNSLYRHFRTLLKETVHNPASGRNFVSITDPGTPLEKIARSEGFRRNFSNPINIGGRYSVLSYFGLVPAALIGIDVVLLLHRADNMRKACASSVPVHENPGAFLGAALATVSVAGHDKLTVITSPSIESFGLWAEQLIAESLGKDCKGIVPIVSEPLLAANHYGSDRFFVYLRMEGDDNTTTDEAVHQFVEGGHPVIRFDLQDRYDLGAEFFRWEFATAVAGAIISVNPFDQPNVQTSKDITDSVLDHYRVTGKLPNGVFESTVQELLDSITEGDYLSVMAYLRQSPEIDQALETLRRRVLEKHGIATTFGYGPRFLHSTGQLHKGGPPSGVFLQITMSHHEDIPIPGYPFSFGTLAEAQALGDREALASTGRRVARLHLDSDIATGILEQANEIAEQ